MKKISLEDRTYTLVGVARFSDPKSILRNIAPEGRARIRELEENRINYELLPGQYSRQVIVRPRR